MTIRTARWHGGGFCAETICAVYPEAVQLLLGMMASLIDTRTIKTKATRCIGNTVAGSPPLRKEAIEPPPLTKYRRVAYLINRVSPRYHISLCCGLIWGRTIYNAVFVGTDQRQQGTRIKITSLNDANSRQPDRLRLFSFPHRAEPIRYIFEAPIDMLSS